MTSLLPQSETPTLSADAVFAGSSLPAERLRLQVARIAPHFRTALLTGEQGTGKRVVAQRMHSLSPVSGGPFREIPAEQFLQSRPLDHTRGTLYVPGLEALEGPSQSAFRLALQSLDRETRVIASSRVELRGLVATGRLRLDLYETIATLQIRLEPLRDRQKDLIEIAQTMVPGVTFSDAAVKRLRLHAWPGNLQELQQVCEGLSRTRMIEAEDLELTAPVASGAEATLRLDDVMQRHVTHVLERCAGNKLRAAEVLGISRSTLYRMLESRPDAS